MTAFCRSEEQPVTAELGTALAAAAPVALIRCLYMVVTFVVVGGGLS
ncbi:hypothetical protein SOVF_033620 [Spinacia oleracea]|nr:hypothetical protein SOVF_033620 [Spinacia oleracea]